MNGLPVEKDTFIDADDKTYRSLEYDMLKHIWKSTRGQDERIKKLESRKRMDTTVAAGTGILGGAMALMGKWFFFRG